MDSWSKPELRHIQVAHQLKSRVRFIAPALRKDQERGYILEILLRKHAAIKVVRAVPDIASVVVRFDPHLLPRRSLLRLLDSVLGVG